VYVFVTREGRAKKKGCAMHTPSASGNHASTILAASLQCRPTFFLSIVTFRKSSADDLCCRICLLAASITSFFVVFIFPAQFIAMLVTRRIPSLSRYVRYRTNSSKYVGSDIQSKEKSFSRKTCDPVCGDVQRDHRNPRSDLSPYS
jgi:hypothetical protein